MFSATSNLVSVFIGGDLPTGSSDYLLQPANDLDTIVLKNFLAVRGVGKFTGKVLGRKVQLFVQISMPPGAIGHIINNPVAGDPLAGGALARITPQFRESDHAGGGVHGEDYTRVKNPVS